MKRRSRGSDAHCFDRALSLVARHRPLVAFGRRKRQAPRTAAVFTAAQATAGQAVYQANCASCHLPDLAGQNEAPPLAGANFMRTWGTRTTRDLVEYMAGDDAAGQAEPGGTRTTSTSRRSSCRPTARPPARKRWPRRPRRRSASIATGQRRPRGGRAARGGGGGDGAPAGLPVRRRRAAIRCAAK